jgi:hypothetical protein
MEFKEVVTTRAAAFIVARVKATTWSAIATWLPIVISLISLAISAIAVWFGAIRPSRQAKAASPTAQLDLLSYESKSGWHEEVRVVITNGGPATMENVTVKVYDGNGNDLAEAEPDITALWPESDVTAPWPKMPVQLHAGQSLYLTLNRSLATPDARAAEVWWRDGRDGEQSRRFVLSYNRVAEQV